MMKRNLILLLAVVALTVGPLWLHGRDGADFGGSDDQATAMIASIQPTYRPWATPIWEPPSAEVESLLFALQAALGAGLLGYYFGRRRGQAEATGGAPRHARD
jgi:cobalt/nickel transport protein